MRQPSALRFVIAAAALLSAAMLGAAIGCGPDQTMIWFCLNPVTGKLQDAPYDATHYVGTTFDPCHCYDPCGPEKTCPLNIDAGPLPPECDAGAASDAGGE